MCKDFKGSYEKYSQYNCCVYLISTNIVLQYEVGIKGNNVSVIVGMNLHTGETLIFPDSDIKGARYICPNSEHFMILLKKSPLPSVRDII